jgi:tetratricopeptide (TPR) repeat protein
MTIDRRTQTLQWVHDLAQTGDNEGAFASINQYLQTNPDDGQETNDAGALLYTMGRFDEAAVYLQKARSLTGDCPQILWNLAELYLTMGKVGELLPLLDPMERQGILNPDILNRTATALLDQNEKGEALELLLRSLKMSPNQQILKPMVEVIRSKRPKIAFFCGADGDRFLTEIYEFARNRFPVEIFSGKSTSEMYELMKWSDISWFEWCTEYAVEASKLPKVCRTIVRLHRWEAYQEYPRHINWDNIDVLITVGNSFVLKTLRQQTPNINEATSVLTIPNGVNLEKFPLTERKRGKNLACVGNINMGKNAMFLLQCMQKLHYIDPEYRLFFAGACKDMALEQYLKHMVGVLGLSDVVFFDGWQEDMRTWLNDKHYIVSTSIIESQGMALLEGMASGLKPIIHHFPGANEIFPNEFLFTISEEFCRLIMSDSYEPMRYREFVMARYGLKHQLDGINRIFTHFENTPFHRHESVATDDTRYACV